VYFVNDEVDVVRALAPILQTEMIIVPTVVVTELWSTSRALPQEMAAIERFLDSAIVMPLDIPLGKMAGTVRRDYRLALGDAIIAATALATDATLITRNVRDFKKVPDLKILGI
jgi:predicted nucleic acid-binding protein